MSKMRQKLNRFDQFLYGILGILCFLKKLEGVPFVVSGSSSDSSTSTKDHTRDLTDEPKILETLISQLSPENGKNENVENTSELAWRDSLLVDQNQSPPDQSDDTLDLASLIPRRSRKPRSPYRSPPIVPYCDKGYEPWGFECFKVVEIDPASQLKFYVDQLNEYYAKREKQQGVSSASNKTL